MMMVAALFLSLAFTPGCAIPDPTIQVAPFLPTTSTIGKVTYGYDTTNCRAGDEYILHG
jgi:hypothetical protein